MRMTELKTLEQGAIYAVNDAYVLYKAGGVVLVQFDIACDGHSEHVFAEPVKSSSGVWISPSQDCLTSDMSLLVFPELDRHSVFSVSVINHGRSVSVCLVKGDVFDLKGE